MADLVTTLSLLDRREPVHTARRYTDQEFLAFLRAVHDGRAGTEKIVLLGGEPGRTLAPSLTQWLNRHPQVSTELCVGTEEWKRKLLDSLRESERGRAPPVPPEGLPSFLHAVSEWDRDVEHRPRPFAWTRGSARSPQRSGP